MIHEEPSWSFGSAGTYPKLVDSVEADVVILGAGITGIFNAYTLSKAGFKVVVLEKNTDILQETTILTTAFITGILDTPFVELISLFGRRKANLVNKSGQDAIKLIADIVRKEHIDCDFESVSAYTYAHDAKQFEKLAEEHGAMKRSGFESRLMVDGARLGFENVGFLEIPGQAKFHPIKFARALAKLAVQAGARILTDSEVVSLDGLTVKTKAGQVRAKDILIATYAPFTNEGTKFKKGMYVSYVYELEITKGLIAEGLYLDMHSPYHYFRIDRQGDFDRMIVGGEDHRKDIPMNPDKNFHALEAYAKTVLGDNSYTINRRWHGPILEPSDGLALIGEIKPHAFVATAFSGNGMTYSAISAMLVRDRLLGHANAYRHVYDPLRVASLRQTIIKATDYIGEFFGGAFKNFFQKNGRL